MTKPLASLSLDLDNKWSYLRTHGVAGWDNYPSYLDTVVPRVLDFCAHREVQITCFVIGRDAQRHQSRNALAALADAGHEIGNHSLNHYPWMHTLTPAEVEYEIAEAESLIEDATGQRPVGFRGPGYSHSIDSLTVLAARGYLYDASILPTFIGPLARWYFHRTASREAAERADRRGQFGKFAECFRSNKPHLVSTAAGPLAEMPVTVFPFLRLPIHMTYLWYLHQFSPRIARAYVSTAMQTCQLLGVGPSILLHPLDFLGMEDEPEMKFFPGMNLPKSQKLEFLGKFWEIVAARFNVVPMRDHAAQVASQFSGGTLASESFARHRKQNSAEARELVTEGT